MKNLLIKIYHHPLAALLTALAGVAVYLYKSIQFITYQYSIIDEGLFLLKGIYFISGTYQPYQDFGFWMNKLPFGYLFAGWLQTIFGPGIRTGRIAAVILGIGLLIGIWLITRRITGNRWLAAVSIWVFALNTSLISIYSHFLTEILVAFFLVWSLFFILGKNRHTLHYLSGGLLLGLILITRQNMLPLLLLLPLYVWWENKHWKAALSVFLPALLIFVFVHILYWPHIAQMWLPWLPQTLTPFLNSFRFEVQGLPFYDPIPPFQTRLHAFWEGVRIHFVPVTASIVSLFLILAQRKTWKTFHQSPHFKLMMFFSITYLLLMVEHFFATILLNYCVYCFSIYLSFFPILGVLALVTLPVLISVPQKTSFWNALFAALFCVGWITGIFFGGWQKLGRILTLQVPRSIRTPFQTVDVWGILHNKFGWSFETLRILLPTLAGVFVSLVLLAIIILGVFLLKKRGVQVNLSRFILLTVLAFGLLLLPSRLLGGEIELTRCNNVIEGFERVGNDLADLIPAQARVYYAGDFSPMVMLYLPEMKIFPQQYEQDYSHRIGGDAATLEQHGYWNDESAQRWIAQSDYLIISEKNFQRLNLSEKIPQDEFSLIYRSEPIWSCSAETIQMLFQRKR